MSCSHDTASVAEYQVSGTADTQLGGAGNRTSNLPEIEHSQSALPPEPHAAHSSAVGLSVSMDTCVLPVSLLLPGVGQRSAPTRQKVAGSTPLCDKMRICVSVLSVLRIVLAP